MSDTCAVLHKIALVSCACMQSLSVLYTRIYTEQENCRPCTDFEPNFYNTLTSAKSYQHHILVCVPLYTPKEVITVVYNRAKWSNPEVLVK